MDELELKAAVEAMIFASGEPVPAARISLVLGVPEQEVFDCAERLAEEYESGGRGIRLVRLDMSLQMCSAPQYAKLIARVIEHRAPPKLSPPALETLAVVAYFQPVTRAYVDEVRGVDSSYTVSSLVEKGLIEPTGRLEAPGRPTLYKTTEAFLRVMGVSELSELPKLPDMASTDGLEKLQGAIEALKGRGEQMVMDLETKETGGEAL
ncbi:MAG TPA: SMC-Scp complex subunit ScpB [Candidatus Scatomorpha pullistercoris]|uniref:SMC-Scp complex subunit ScpB n=1 Tax=Candidatus Scatomorpha pullistercoris TaxID=2840929 RepID=A0A9D1K800_9FIRM|nr:SMC-Scp complex subunit ScpB [Candidatus Scatomorpha pullistercoris]